MQFKDMVVEKEYEGAPLLLRIMAEEFEKFSSFNFGKEPVVTRVLEAIPGDAGVHEDYRALDIRQEHDGVFMYTPDEQDAILTYFNKRYKRNDGKLSIICHSFNGSPFHFHLQIAVFTKAYQ